MDFDGVENIKITSVFLDIAGKLVPYFVIDKTQQKNQAYLYLEDIDTIEKAAMLVRKDITCPIRQNLKRKRGIYA
jgi:16S rRNA processing protein RimM